MDVKYIDTKLENSTQVGGQRQPSSVTLSSGEILARAEAGQDGRGYTGGAGYCGGGGAYSGHGGTDGGDGGGTGGEFGTGGSGLELST